MPERRRALRNPVATSPLMRKGGVHRRPRSGQRQRERDDHSRPRLVMRPDDGRCP